MDVMWWLHTKFTIAVVLIALVLLLSIPISMILGDKFIVGSFDDVKKVWDETKTKIYGGL
jgi:hypothetical protein